MKSNFLELHALSPQDKEQMLDILTNPIIKQTYMLPDFEKREDAAPLFIRLMELSLSNAHYVRAICWNGVTIGFLNDVENQGGSIELGYVIHPAYQNRGYATEALGGAIRDLFENGYAEIITGAFEDNLASIRVMEKCGMTKLDKQDEIEYRGVIHRCVYYSIKKQE